MTLYHMPEAPPFEGLRASRYFAGWSEPGPSRVRWPGTPWERHGFDLFGSDPLPDRPTWSPPDVHLPDHDPRWYRSIPIWVSDEPTPAACLLGDLRRAPHFGRDHHDAETWVDGRPAPLARFSLESAAEKSWQPGFSYRLEGPTGWPLARIESQRSLNIENGVDAWRCTTATGSSVEARYRPPARPPDISNAERALRLLFLVPCIWASLLQTLVFLARRPERRRVGLHDQWVDGAVLGPEGGWELVDEWGRPVLWMLPPGVGHLSNWALVGPHRASLAAVDPAVVLFGFFILYACTRPRSSEERNWVT